MPRETCWSCEQLEDYVTLCADDRWCGLRSREWTILTATCSVDQSTIAKPKLTRKTIANSATTVKSKKTTDESNSKTRTTEDENSDSDEVSCSHCLLPVCDKRVISCDICCSRFHQKCTLIPIKVFDKLIVNVGTTGLVCEDCRASARQSYRRLETATAHLAQELATTKIELADELAGMKVALDELWELHESKAAETMHRATQPDTGVKERGHYWRDTYDT